MASAAKATRVLGGIAVLSGMLATALGFAPTASAGQVAPSTDGYVLMGGDGGAFSFGVPFSGVRNKSVWERACGLTRTVVESVDFDEAADAVLVAVQNERAGWRVSDCRAPIGGGSSPASVWPRPSGAPYLPIGSVLSQS